MAIANVTAQRLREVLNYDAETGIFTWRVRMGSVAPKGKVAGCKCGEDYTVIKIDQKVYLAHRLAWLYATGEHPRFHIDHVNGIRNDNRFSNLRDVSRHTNAQNQRGPQTTNRSGFLGVSLKAGKWEANIHARGKDYYLGRYESAELASEAYLEAKRAIHPGGMI